MTFSPESPAYAAIREGIALREQSRAPAAKALLETLVDDVEKGTDAFAKIFLAHSPADVQETPEDELAWDLRALAFMDELTGQEAIARDNPGGKAALLPSLHLNLAADYRRLGDETTARLHYNLGKAHLNALADDAYGDSIRAAFTDEAFQQASGRSRGAVRR
ncbi:hypothetical protein [Kribbella sp. CA-293567]|uniref:hypothetical protein n=1 Tax=Kribbella sp. CA-293567 TaxID=3002436 RepID=UPI0022DDD405|nr:hypothetical protein [Kribbella sp. CA-293567]WBQ02439.1 hypothetical protein OX958_20895 [Kribbella sp. CA-293567]